MHADKLFLDNVRGKQRRILFAEPQSGECYLCTLCYVRCDRLGFWNTPNLLRVEHAHESKDEGFSGFDSFSRILVGSPSDQRTLLMLFSIVQVRRRSCEFIIYISLPLPRTTLGKALTLRSGQSWSRLSLSLQ